MLGLFLAACTGPATPVPTPPDPPATGDTGAPPTPVHTADTGLPALECASIPSGPWSATQLTGPPATEDFAFDGPDLISHENGFLTRSAHPPGPVVPWVSAQPGTVGPSSLRRLPSGDLVYHNVDTGTLYRVQPDGATTVVFSGFGYAGGIEVHPAGHIYVVDIVGLRRIDPVTQDQVLGFQTAPWQSPNGITLSVDSSVLYISAHNGIWAVPLDAAGAPSGGATLWADAPAGQFELLGMGTDRCDNVYVVTTSFTGSSTLWRYPAGGGAPVEVFAVTGGYLSNLQWGSGAGGWDAQTIYVVDRSVSAGGYWAVDVGVGEKPR
ncbi:MAG: hypothetical protein R3F61_21370 [Myxococcota bacterium]